jgi:chlorite dismutase
VAPLLVAFAGGTEGEWRVESITSIRGVLLPAVERVAVRQGEDEPRATWILRGFTSNERYTTCAEHDQLVAKQQLLGRPEATLAALIPIRKSEEWWSLSQDQRRAIFEESSRHIAIGLEYLPAVARRLHHSRDLGEPFDFLTWFEFAPKHADAFDDLVRRLRETEEWNYVEREVDLRLTRSQPR